jgi:hypothetical protein
MGTKQPKKQVDLSGFSQEVQELDMPFHRIDALMRKIPAIRAFILRERPDYGPLRELKERIDLEMANLTKRQRARVDSLLVTQFVYTLINQGMGEYRKSGWEQAQMRAEGTVQEPEPRKPKRGNGHGRPDRNKRDSFRPEQQESFIRDLVHAGQLIEQADSASAIAQIESRMIKIKMIQRIDEAGEKKLVPKSKKWGTHQEVAKVIRILETKKREFVEVEQSKQAEQPKKVVKSGKEERAELAKDRADEVIRVQIGSDEVEVAVEKTKKGNVLATVVDAGDTDLPLGIQYGLNDPHIPAELIMPVTEAAADEIHRFVIDSAEVEVAVRNTKRDGILFTVVDAGETDLPVGITYSFSDRRIPAGLYKAVAETYSTYEEFAPVSEEEEGEELDQAA